MSVRSNAVWRDAARARLVRLLAAKSASHERRLTEMRKAAAKRRRRPAVVWLLLLQSAATMGGSRGWEGLFQHPILPSLISFDAVRSIDEKLRADYMATIPQTAGVRWPAQKAQRLAVNHDVIRDLGGELAARTQAFRLHGREAKLAFMRQFRGIGDKYASNVWMDLCDPDFETAIAYDERLQRIGKALGAKLDDYETAERFFVAIAAESGRTPWETDRILYHFNDAALAAIEDGSY